MSTLWWLCFFTAMGLCLGSFLNAVIYRLPRNRSLRDPLWSMCPHCQHRIHWYDNLPVISFILLRGRCRHCGDPISTRYIVVELFMAIVVLMLLDAFCVGQVRSGLSDSPFGLTDRLSYDWPILAAHIILFACLLPMSVIDLEHYWVDVRFTNLATIVGFVLHTLWTPKHSAAWVRPWDTTAVMSLFALIALGIVWLLLICQPDADPEESGESSVDEASPAQPELSQSRRSSSSLAPLSWSAGLIPGLMLLAMFLALLFDEARATETWRTGRVLLPLLLFFMLVVSESTVVRSADREIIEAIYEERHGARRMVLFEFVLLLPAVIAAAVGVWIMLSGGELSAGISDALHASTHVPGIAMMRNWSPLEGLTTAATGYIIAGGVGWAVRIVFTLVFGKEAYGSGDIHLMAATGCVAGWPVVVLGFFLTCGLAMVGWVAALPFKRTRALPLGPWLALSFLTVVVFYDRIIEWPLIARAVSTLQWLLFGGSQVPAFEGLR
ncbi:MAG: prepilin peptidase [Phycisphaerae bacterium]